MSAERLHKVLAHAGIASRRACEELITTGRVRVNGEVVRELGTRVDLAQATIHVDGQPVHVAAQRAYVLLHKPPGVVSTADDPEGRPTVVQLVDSPLRLFPVGRLDAMSEGLLLLTNDGALTHRLTHPRYEIEKEYHVLLDHPLDSQALLHWRAGVLLDNQRTAAAEVDPLPTESGEPWLRVVLHEGRNRQIRAVAQQLGAHVRRLIRVREGPLTLGDVPAGQWRELRPAELAALREHAGLPAETTARP